MNVKKKLKLTNVFESYWDMLPPEIQEHVIGFKISQECIDEKRKDKLKDLCMEIVKYGELKREWNMGHVKYIVKKEMCFSCCKYHLRIMGCYVGEKNIPRERFLGYGFEEALGRVNHVKSFL